MSADKTNKYPALTGFTTPHIHQRYDYDCAVACLAMLYGADYDIVHRGLRICSTESLRHGIHIDLAAKYSSRLGYLCTRVIVNDDNRDDVFSAIQGARCIIIAKARDFAESGDYHSVYWTGKECLDPSPNRPYGKSGVAAMQAAVEIWVVRKKKR